MRRINGIEQRLLLVEIGAIDFVAELDDPARLATPSTNLKLHRPHQRVPKKIRTAPGFQRGSIDTSFGGQQFRPHRMRLPTFLMRQAVALTGLAECDGSDAYRGDDRDLAPRGPSA